MNELVKSFLLGGEKKYPKYDVYQRGFASMVYKFLDENSAVCNVTRADKSVIKSEIMTNQCL